MVLRIVSRENENKQQGERYKLSSEATQFFELLKGRHSIRKFLPKDVAQWQLDFLLQSANHAPSAGNLQSYEIIVVTNEAYRKRLVKAAGGQDFLAEAPVCLIFCALPQRAESQYGARGSNLYCVQDATIAASYVQLAASTLGLGTVWVGAFDEGAVRSILELEEGNRPIVILPVGQRGEEATITSRKELKELVRIIPDKFFTGVSTHET